MIQKSKFISPIRFFSLIILSILIVEFGIMLILEHLINFSPDFENIIDAFLLTLIVYPVLYYFAYKPLVESEKTLEDSEIKTRSILENIGDGMIATDAGGKVIAINDQFEKLLNLKKEDVIGKQYSTLWKMEDSDGNIVPNEKRPIQIALSGKRISTSDYLYIRNDNSKFPVTITASPVILNNHIEGMVGIFRDITHEKEVDKAKTEFVSLASHQMRTPVTTINWYSEMLLGGKLGELNDEQKKYLTGIYQSNQRMIKTINAFLNVSRIELGTFMIERKSVDLFEASDDTINELQPEISSRKIKIDKEYGNVRPIDADPNAIRIIFQNLISNAVKYSPEEGKVVIRISQKGEEVIIEVESSGLDIPQEDQQKLFSKFFRTDKAKEMDPNGNGLGLYIVKSILEHSGGKIWLKSPVTDEGKGTIFYVSIPVTGMIEKKGEKKLS